MQRPNALPGPRLAATLLVAYGLVGAVLVLGPLPVRGLDVATDAVRGLGSPVGGLLTRTKVEALANLVLFVPVGFLVRFIWPRRPAGVLLAGCVAASALVEGYQLVLTADRYGTLRDILLNGAGAAAGLAAAHLAIRLLARRHAPS